MAVGVEAARRASRSSCTRAGRLLAQHAHRARAGGAAAGGERVRGVELGRVVVGQRGGDPALGPVAGGLRERRAGDERDAGALGRRPSAPRRGRPRRRRRPRRRLAAAPEGSHGASVRYRRACRSTSATRPRLSTTPATATPSGRSASARSRRELERARLVRLRASRGAGGDDGAAAGRAPARARRRRRASTSARGGAFDLDTPARPAPGRPRCTRPAAPARWRRRWSAAASGSASPRCARPATTPSRPRDGVLPVRERVRGRPPRARLARRRAGAGARLGRAPRQRDQRDLPRVAARCCSRASTSTRSIPAPGRSSDVGSGEGEGYSMNLPVPAGSGEEEFCALVEHVVLPAARAVRARTWCWCRPATTPTATTRSAAARSRPPRTRSWRRAGAHARQAGRPVLEGGYDLDALAGAVAATMEALAAAASRGLTPRERAGRARRRGGRALLGI